MDTETLINVISRKPAIWMTKHPQHRYRSVTGALWEEVKKEFPDTEVHSLRKKWKYLKYTYRRQLKKSQTNWKYFEMMGFLKDQYEDDEHETDPLNIERNNGDSAEDASSIVEASSPVIISSSPPSPAPLPNFAAVNCEENSHQQSDTLRAFRKRPIVDNDNQTNAVNTKKKFETMEKQFSIEDVTKSDDYYFLMSLLPQIIKLPPIQKLRLRNKFHQAVLDEMSACYGKS
ncbi:hypothetical protein ABMA27_006649 [Loxostege sticticalis]|uniref:BESS domain-containing protein n=1 Tax=Loxostege sticticalis TaxID=481309 RepID=A0ABR3IK16_LOXSC